ncbi:MAG: hypothetical protein AAFU60_13015, partial [Bacteroidota bacterium]
MEAQAITPILECIIANGDGETFTAYYGYDNPNGFEVEVSIGEDNRFNSESSDLGQPTVFLPGRVEGAFSVTFTLEDELEWTLNGNTTTTAADNEELRCDIRPVAECVQPIKFNSDVDAARFGYVNNEAFTIEVPVGLGNELFGEEISVSQVQTTTFLPGYQSCDFLVPLNGPISWFLLGRSVTVNPDDRGCSSFTLINTENGEAFELNKGDKININDESIFGDGGLQEFTVVLDRFPFGTFQVEFNFTGPGPYQGPINRVEKVEPYSLFGDRDGEFNGRPAVLSNPDYIIIVRVSSFRETFISNSINNTFGGEDFDPFTLITEDSVRWRFELLEEEEESEPITFVQPSDIDKFIVVHTAEEGTTDNVRVLVPTISAEREVEYTITDMLGRTFTGTLKVPANSSMVTIKDDRMKEINDNDIYFINFTDRGKVSHTFRVTK